MYFGPCTVTKGASPASLDPHETNVAPPPASPSPAKPPTPDDRLRLAVLAAFQTTYVPHYRKIRYEFCGQGWWLLRNKAEPRRYKVTPDFCHDRFCPTCARARGAHVRQVLLPLLAAQRTRAITLTLRAQREPLRKRLALLYRAYRRLRQTPLWKERTTAAVAQLELTWNPHRRTFHPHLHVIQAGSYIPQPALAREWLAATGDSFIVDIRKVSDTAREARHFAKYITKPIHASILTNPPVLADVVEALQHKRLLIATGTWARRRWTTPTSEPGWALIDHVSGCIVSLNIDPWTQSQLDPWLRRVHLGLDEREIILEHPPPGCGAQSFTGHET